ncbi:unnamed protein product [Orchesella dallaii]|uniref:Cytochrome P450 n=1 Tax=Orchesella dallaii TaxID=48710 RepID=A0ABP1QKM5_9HEXA
MIEILISIIYIVTTILVGAITTLIVYARWHYGSLEKVQGLVGVVKPYWVGGSDIFLHNKVIHVADAENVKKYGKVFGYYEGRTPHIFIADPEMIRLIFIKDFDHFHNKRALDFGHPLVGDMMDMLPYDRWKIVRSFISPSLTTGKIRNMSTAMTEAITEWMNTLKEQLHNKQEPFHPRKMYRALTTDIIARCAFGMKINTLHDPDHIFNQKLNQIAMENMDINFMFTVAHVFPFIFKMIEIFPLSSLDYFGDILRNVMKVRKESKITVNDFLDTLNEMVDKCSNEEYKQHKITEVTVMCQAMVFFLAGFETTTTTLSSLTYNFAKNPKVQEKAVEELDSYLKRHEGKIEHETIGELTYLAACMQESLRMHSPAIRLERVCNKEWHHEPSDLKIEKGMTVQVPIFAVHYDEEYFPNPTKFDPERFLPENKHRLNPYAVLQFGQGPHNCIGMRFAKEEILLTFANVLKEYTFKANETTKFEFLPGRNFVVAVKPFNVDAIPRMK